MNYSNLTLAALISLATAGPLPAQHVDDVWVGRSADGRLGLGGFAHAGEPVVLPPSGGLFPGWSDNEPGFDAVTEPQPDVGLWPLEPGAMVRLEVIAFDEGLRAVDSGFQILDMPGDQTLLGGASLHAHLTWNIDLNHPAFDSDEYLWNATFRVIDTGSTGYEASEAVTLPFLNVDRLAGDINGDGVVDALDLTGFVDLLLDDAAATREMRAAADINLDRAIDGADIQPFVAALLDET